MDNPDPNYKSLRLRQNPDAPGATFSIVIHGKDGEEMKAAVSAAFGELHRLEEVLSNYRADSEWSFVNREAGKRPVQVSAELFAILSSCIMGFETQAGRGPDPVQLRFRSHLVLTDGTFRPRVRI